MSNQQRDTAVKGPSTAIRMRAVYKRMTDHEVVGRGAQMAFYFLIAIFPMLVAAVGMLSVLHLDSNVATLEFFVSRGMPPGVAELILHEIHGLRARTGWPLLLTLIITAYYGGNGATSALAGVARAHAIERHLGLTQLLGLGFVGLFVLALPAVLTAVTALTWAVAWASRHGFVPVVLAYAVESLGWPLMFFLFQQLVNGVYRLGAKPAVRWGWFSRGSVTATLAWIVITFGFELYLRTVTDLGATYGSLGAVVGLLLYAHVISVCVLVGAEVDAEWMASSPR